MSVLTLSGQYSGIFRSQDQLFRKFFDASSLSSILVLNSLTAIRKAPEPKVDFSNFKQHVFFNSAELKTLGTLNKIISTYPIGLSGTPVNSLTTSDVAAVDNYLISLNGWEKYVLNYIAGVTGNTSLFSNPTITASAVTLSGNTVALPVIFRNVNNTISGSQSALTANIYSLALAFDSGLNTVQFVSGTSDSNIVYFDDGSIITTNILPSIATEYVNRGSILSSLLPQSYFVNDDARTLETYISVMGTIFDEIKIYIDEFSNLTHVSYDDYHRVPNGEIQQLLAKHFGFDLMDTLYKADISKYLRRESDREPLYKVAHKLWNRILNNLIYILKKKGTPEAVNAIIRSYGLPANYIQIDDYSFHPEPDLQHKIEYKNVRTLALDGQSYIIFPISLSSNFIVASAQDFTIESRVSTSAFSNSYIFKMGNSVTGYSLKYANGSFYFNIDMGTSSSSASTLASSSAILKNSLSTNYVNVFGIRRGSSSEIWATWVDESSGTAIFNTISSTVSSSNSSISAQGASFPFTIGSSAGLSSWSGNIHQAKMFKYALGQQDIIEHTLNYESISFMNTPNGSLSGIVGQWPLKENQVLSGTYGTVVNTLSTTVTGTASGTLTSTNMYQMIEGMRKETSFMNMGEFVEDNVQTYINNSNSKFRKSGDVHIAFRPVYAINNDIINVYGDLDISSAVSDPSNFYLFGQQNYYPSMMTTASVIFSRYAGSKIDFNSYIKAIENISPVINGIMDSINQVVPARTNVINRGITIESHLLERNRVVKDRDTLIPSSNSNSLITIIDNNMVLTDTDLSRYTIGELTAIDNWTSKTYSTTDYYSVSSEQLQYLSNFSTINTSRVISTVTNTFFYPAQQSVNNKPDTKIVTSLNRTFLKNDSTVSDWTTSISGYIKLTRGSTGKLITSLENSVRIELPFTASGNPVSATENYFYMTVNNQQVLDSNYYFNFTIPQKQGLQFVISRKPNFSNMNIGIVYMRIFNLLSGGSDQIPIVIGISEAGFGGTLVFNTNFQSNA